MARPAASPVLVAIGAVAGVLGVGILAAALAQYAGFAMQAELRDKVLTRPSPFLPEVRAREDAELAGYRVIDAKTGVIGLPLERALELTLRDRRQP